MSDGRPRLKEDPWLAGQLGRNAFSLLLPGEGVPASEWRDEIPELLAACPRPAFCFVKVPTLDTERVRVLGEAGFSVVDVNVTLERSPGPVFPGLGEGIQVAPCTPDQSPALLDIAGACFRFSRFHLDDRIPLGLAHALKRAWVENYTLGKRGEELLAATLNGRPAGFLAVLAVEDRNHRVRVIDLVGVAPDLQGRGLGKALVNHFCSTSRGKCDLVRVGTQAANIPSLKLYQGAGFRAEGSAYVLHAHLEDRR